MITLRNGSKLKIKDSSFLFGHEIYLTKVGYVVQFRREDFVFASLWEAEEKVLEIVKEKNLYLSTFVYSRKHCLAYSDASQIRKDWTHPGADNSFIYWGLEGGQAVAVKVDSLGKPIDYLSLCDWSNKHNWRLPTGDWHYFTAFRN